MVGQIIDTIKMTRSNRYPNDKRLRYLSRAERLAF